MVWSAPRLRARCSFSSEDDVTKIVAAMALGNLQRKYGNAASAKNQHGISRLKSAVDDESPPSGHAGRGKRCSLGERIAFRRAGEGGRWRQHYFARVSINTIA